MEFYMSLKKEQFEKHKKVLMDESIEMQGDDGLDEFVFCQAVEFVKDELYFDEDTNKIMCNGNIHIKGEELGYVSIGIPLDFEMVISIIEVYRKKLGKLKTVLEATK